MNLLMQTHHFLYLLIYTLFIILCSKNLNRQYFLAKFNIYRIVSTCSFNSSTISTFHLFTLVLMSHRKRSGKTILAFNKHPVTPFHLTLVSPIAFFRDRYKVCDKNTTLLCRGEIIIKIVHSL